MHRVRSASAVVLLAVAIALTAWLLRSPGVPSAIDRGPGPSAPSRTPAKVDGDLTVEKLLPSGITKGRIVCRDGKPVRPTGGQLYLDSNLRARVCRRIGELPRMKGCSLRRGVRPALSARGTVAGRKIDFQAASRPCVDAFKRYLRASEVLLGASPPVSQVVQTVIPTPAPDFPADQLPKPTPNRTGQVPACTKTLPVDPFQVCYRLMPDGSQAAVSFALTSGDVRQLRAGGAKAIVPILRGAAARSKR